MEIWEQLEKKCITRIERLQREIAEIKKRQREDEFVYGVGGAYR